MQRKMSNDRPSMLFMAILVGALLMPPFVRNASAGRAGGGRVVVMRSAPRVMRSAPSAGSRRMGSTSGRAAASVAGSRTSARQAARARKQAKAAARNGSTGARVRNRRKQNGAYVRQAIWFRPTGVPVTAKVQKCADGTTVYRARGGRTWGSCPESTTAKSSKGKTTTQF